MKRKILVGIVLSVFVCSAQAEFRGMDSSYDCGRSVGYVAHCDELTGENPWSRIETTFPSSDTRKEAKKQSRWKMTLQHSGFGHSIELDDY